MPAENMPAAEVEIDVDLVRALLEEQLPDLAGRDVVLVANGWDNVMYRLGREFVVRLPRRQLAADLIATEQRWLPELAPHLPLPVPATIHAGQPGCGYPWSWSVCPWLPGEPALHTPASDLHAAADALGGFVRALHSVPTPDDPPANPYRGVPLADRDEWTRNAMLRIDAPGALDEWERALDIPMWSGPPIWLHGDFHPGNLLVHRGVVSAVIDFGDMTAGDPATDLFIAWALFPPDVREVFRAAAGDIDDDTWARGRAWALALGSVVIANSADNPAYTRLGRRMVDAVLAS